MDGVVGTLYNQYQLYHAVIICEQFPNPTPGQDYIYVDLIHNLILYCSQPYNSMGKMIQNYSLQSQIGRGMYSTVFKAINMKNKQEVAIKMVKAQKFKQYPKLQQGTYNEINILSNLQPCQHIIKYFDMLKTANNFYFVYQFCNGGTLQKLLKQKGQLPQRVALTYFSQIVDAFKVLNKHNIMHRDLKPQNLLLHDGIIKLADFGFCKPLENQDQISKTMLGSPIYMAPEILKGEPYCIKSDIWSLGVVLFRMLYGFCPFESNNIGKLIMIIEEEDIVIPSQPSIAPEVVKLIRRMITKNPALRADWSQVFAYQVRNGVLLRTGTIRDKTPKSNNLKRSFTLTETTNANSLTASQNLQASMRGQKRLQGSELIYNPRANTTTATNNELRSTYTAKSPFRQNFKKDIMIKNHQKCIEIMSLSISLASYQQTQPLALSFLIMRNVDKQLTVILQSVRKEYQLKNQEPMMRNFISFVETELAEVRNLMMQLREELRGELDYSLELIQSKRRELLKKFITNMGKQRVQDLVLASRVLDYVVDELVIRRETFEKMSREKLLANLRSKVQAL